LPGLSRVVRRSHGDLLFDPGAAGDLTAKILILYRDAPPREQLARNARAFAVRERNRETEMEKFAVAFAEVCRARLDVTLNCSNRS